MRVVRLETDRLDGVRVLTLDDPGRRNALTPAMMQELPAAIATVAADPYARVLVIAAEGPAFCAGADLATSFSGIDRPVAEFRESLLTVYASFLRIRGLTIPVIAAVQGPAIGAGLNLALSCDLRVAGPRASFGATFVSLGIHPGGGCTHYLVRSLGAQRALALLLDGSSLDAASAVAAGIVLEIAENPLARALSMAERYALLDAHLIRNIKRSVAIAASCSFSESVEFESWAQAASAASSPQLSEAIARFNKPHRDPAAGPVA